MSAATDQERGGSPGIRPGPVAGSGSPARPGPVAGSGSAARSGPVPGSGSVTGTGPVVGPAIAPIGDDGALGAGAARPISSGRRRPRARDSFPHASRFRVATGLLVGLAIGALAIAATIATGGRRHAAPQIPWSQWSPPDGGALGAREIADYIAPFYRLSPVDQLAVVTVVNLESPSALQAAAASGSTAPGSGLVVAVRQDPSSSTLSLLGGNTIAYELCGIGGPNCAIGTGRPSTSRLLLLRREALELALYTFRYISATDNVVAILPPGHAVSNTTARLTRTPPSTVASSPGSTPIDVAVLFERRELAPLLSHPLVDTLPEQVPPTVAQMASAPEAGLVDQVTARGLFKVQQQTAPDGTRLIVLNPLPPS